MEPTSVILFALPRIVREFVRDAAGANSDVRLVAELRRSDDLVAVARETPGRLAVVSGTALSQRQIAEVLCPHPEARVLELVDDGRDAVLYELRPHRVKLGQVSPRSLVEWIRTPPFVSETG